MAQRIKAETGKDVTLIAVFATTYIKGKIVYYYLYSPYRSTQTVTLPARQAQAQRRRPAAGQQEDGAGARERSGLAPSRGAVILIGNAGCPWSARTDPGRSP